MAMSAEEFAAKYQPLVEQSGLPITKERNVWEKMVDSASRSYRRSQIMDQIFEAGFRVEPDKEMMADARQQLQSLNDEVLFDPIEGNKASNLLYGASGFIGQQTKRVKNSAKYAGAGAALGLAGGLAFPTAGEEPITAATGALIGLKVGYVSDAFREGVAEIYVAMNDMGIDDTVAKPLAGVFGLPYAALEYAQGAGLLPAATKGLKNKVLAKTMPKLSKFLTKPGAEWLTRYGTILGTEILEENAQEITQIVAEETAKILNTNGIKTEPITVKEFLTRNWETTKGAFNTFALIPIGSATLETLASTPSKSIDARLKQVIGPEIPDSYIETAEGILGFEREASVSPIAQDIADQSGMDPVIAQTVLMDLFETGRVALNDATKVDGVKQALINTGKQKLKESPEDIAGASKGYFRDLKDKVVRKVANFHGGATRLRYIFRALDNGEDGLFVNLMHRTTNYLANKAKLDYNDGLNTEIDTVKGMLGDRSTNTLFQRQRVEGTKNYLTASERMKIYMGMKNQNNRNHLLYGNGLTSDTITNIINSLTPEERAIADYILDWYDNNWEGIAATYKQVTDKDLGKEEFFSPIFVQKGEVANFDDFVQVLEHKGRVVPQQVVNKAHTKERTGAVTGLDLETGAIEDWFRYMNWMHHYKNLAPHAKDMRTLIQDDRIRQLIQKKTKGTGEEIINEWFNDVFAGHVNKTERGFSKLMGMLRRNSVVNALGLNLSVALKQPVSFTLAMAEDPRLLYHTWDNLQSMSPESILQFAESKSQMVKSRSFDRDLRELHNRKDAKRLMNNRRNLSEISLSGIRYMDKMTVALAWKSAYDLAQNNELNEDASIQYADSIIAKTQPMANIHDLPHFFRGNTLEKTFTTFQNQINQNYNYWIQEVIKPGFKGKISPQLLAYRVFMSMILPAVLLSTVTHGGPPEPEQFARDSASFFVSPIFFYGPMASALLQGYDPSASIALESFERLGYAAKDFKQGEVFGGAMDVAQAIGAATGLPTKQVIRTVEGMKDLEEGETTDPRRLIYGPAALGESKKPKKKIKRSSGTGRTTGRTRQVRRTGR